MTNDNQSHPLFEQLSDYVDGRLAPASRLELETHLALCSRCARDRDRLEALLDQSRALPAEVAAPVEIWTDVHQRIAPVRSSGTHRAWLLAAAAVLLVAVSSAVTALLVRRPQTMAVRHEQPPVPLAAVRLPVAARAVDADYQAVIRELDESLAQRRAQLAPETIAKVEASLRVVDDAIGEARRALAADPANRDLVDLLAASYERKLELLRRASELLPAT
jgi:anti-sigma factor RsiW